MKKKFLKLGIVAILCMSVIACSSSNTNVNSSTNNAQNESTENKSSSNDNKEVVQIEFWDMIWGGSSYVEEAQRLVEQFNSEHPHIQVNYQSTPWNDWYQTFSVAIASGTAPDISTGAGYQAFQFTQSAGAILPLDDVIEELRAEGKLDDFIPGSIEAMKYNGHYMAIPWNVDVRIPVYRKDIYEEAGITELPKTLEELREVLKKINGSDRYGLAVPGNDSVGVQFLFTMMLNHGGGIFSEDGKIDVFNEQNLEAVKYISELVNDGSINPAMIGFTHDDALKDFGTGRASTYVTSPSIFSDLPDMVDQIGVLDPLTGPNGDAVSLGWINNIMLYKDSEHPEETKEFLKWWIDNNSTLWTVGKAGSFPARISFTEDPYYTENEHFRAISEKYLPIIKTTGSKLSGSFPELNEIEGDGSAMKAIQQIIGKVPYEESLKEMEGNFKKIMKE